jgi:murein L,D-transpeptidase YcbB/YkuD
MQARAIRSAIRFAALAAMAAFALLSAGRDAGAQPSGETIAAEMRRAAEAAGSEALRKRIGEIDAYYATGQYASLWFADGKPTAKALSLVDALALAAEDGLDPLDYDAEGLKAKASATDEAGQAQFEVHLSVAAVSFAQHLNAGRIAPAETVRETVIYPNAVAPAQVLDSMRKTQHVKAYLRLLAPHTSRYERLREALSAYRRIETAGGFSPVPDGPPIKEGMTDERMPAIRKRLAQIGLVQESADKTYDPALLDAVKRFQEQMGLPAEGYIGPATIKAMNVSVAERIATLALNMERNRWLQNEFADYHVFANLADQVVKLVKDGDTLHAEVIQVGQPFHRTPVFTEKMEWIEFNPYWSVPPSIAVNEYLPKLKNGSGILGAQNIRVFAGAGEVSAASVDWASLGKGRFPYTLRQDPGEGNALGRVKFVFPNSYNVYMHDTPSKSKFEAAQRYFSHGCLRLRNPLKLAEIILQSEGWTRARIDAAVATGKNTVVKLKTQIPVYVVYLTAFANKDGSIHFREDVYGNDKILAAALARVKGR